MSWLQLEHLEAFVTSARRQFATGARSRLRSECSSLFTACQRYTTAALKPLHGAVVVPRNAYQCEASMHLAAIRGVAAQSEGSSLRLIAP